MNLDYGKIYRELMSGLYTPEQLDKIKDSKISISGVGGSIGSYLADVLVRKGFEHFALAEPERYELRNLSRQLFANVSTLDLQKIDVSLNHLLSINPNISCDIFHKVDLDTIEEFTKDSTVMAYQAEGFSPWVLTHYMCSKYGVPFVNVARKGNLRTTMALKIIDYKVNPDSFKIQSVDFQSFGIPSSLEERLVEMFESGRFNKDLLDETDATHREYKKKKRFKDLDKQFPHVGPIINKFPKDYFKRYTDPEICLTAAAMASRAITNLVLGYDTKVVELDLFSR